MKVTIDAVRLEAFAQAETERHAARTPSSPPPKPRPPLSSCSAASSRKAAASEDLPQAHHGASATRPTVAGVARASR